MKLLLSTIRFEPDSDDRRAKSSTAKGLDQCEQHAAHWQGSDGQYYIGTQGVPRGCDW